MGLLDFFKVDKFANDGMAQTPATESEPQKDRIQWSSPPPEWVKKKNEKARVEIRDSKPGIVQVHKRNLIRAIDRVESVMRSWMVPDCSETKKHGCVIRNRNSDLVLEVGFDSFNRSEVIYGTVIERGVCGNSYFSNLVIHTQLREVVEECKDNIRITSPCRDQMPIFFNDKKVKSTMVNPWDVGEKIGDRIDLEYDDAIAVASKTWHGLENFELRSDPSEIVLVSHGIPNFWGRPEFGGIGFVKKMGTKGSGLRVVRIGGDVKAFRPLLYTLRNNEPVSVAACDDGFMMEWDDSYVIGKTVIDKGVGRIDDLISTNTGFSSFHRPLMVDSVRWFINHDFSMVGYSDTTPLGVHVDGFIRSYMGEEMTCRTSEKVTVFETEDYRAAVDAAAFNSILGSTTSTRIGISILKDGIIVDDGGDRFWLPDTSKIRNDKNSTYMKRKSI